MAINEENDIDQKSTCAKIAQVAKDGKIRKMNVYNLDMIISVGYRVNSKQATQFRIWATSILKKHLTQGYTINRSQVAKNDDRFMKAVAEVKALLPASKPAKAQDPLFCYYSITHVS